MNCSENYPFASKETLEQLDWPWVLEQLQQYCRTRPAFDRCHELIWQTDRDAALLMLNEVEEARSLLSQGHPFPLGSPPDIRPLQPRILKGAVLQPPELLDLVSWMETIEAVRKYLVARRQQAPLLYRFVETAPSLTHLIYDIRSCIDENGEVRDEASPELGGMRRKERKTHREIHAKLEAYLHASEYQNLLQDRYYSIKEDRYVLPIKTNQKMFVDGIVLGSSNSGATLFIEPREIVELNNTYKLALMETQKEILRILQEISEHIQQEARELEKGQHFLTAVDLISARARLSNALKAVTPTLDREKGIQLFQARHPILFLTKDHVVANDILVTPPTSTIIITGPNAGGKTAALKTVGLFALMAHAGLPLPTEEGSNIPFFDMVFSDIGDNQSLEENRSTFSGHVLRLVDFLKYKQSFNLALLDEIFIGTNPEEGSVLAQAFLEDLSNTGGFSLATTHFLALEALSVSDPRIQNASLGFHPQTFVPTYQLTPGIPGSSNAFFIAGQLGLPDAILDRARSLQGGGGKEIQELIMQIQAAKSEAEAERNRWQEKCQAAEIRQQELEQKASAVADREREIKRKYRERLEYAFNDALNELKQWKQQGKTAAASGPVSAQGKRELRELKEHLFSENGMFHLPPSQLASIEKVNWPQVRCGDFVFVPELQTDAKILTMPDRRGVLTVEAKGFRMQVKADNIYKPHVQRKILKGQKHETPATKKAGMSFHASDDAPTAEQQRCDLRGMNSEEALIKVSQDLDRGFRSKLPRMVLIHGLGKGILRDVVRKYLGQAPYPLTFRPGRSGEGGDGVTVVEFKVIV